MGRPRHPVPAGAGTARGGTMKRNSMLTTMALLCGAASAFAQSGSATGQAAAAADAGSVGVLTGAQTSAEAQASAEQMQQIEARGARVAAKTRARAEARLDKAASQVDAQASHGEQQVASRLAADFGMSAEAMETEKTDLGASWGQLMIAHTLAANATSDLTVQQLLEMRTGGAGWGQIAAGMGLTLGDVVSAVNAEQRVADGLARADGKVAVIHGEGARAGVGAGVGVNAGPGAKGLGVGANVGGGIKIGH